MAIAMAKAPSPTTSARGGAAWEPGGAFLLLCIVFCFLLLSAIVCLVSFSVASALDIEEWRVGLKVTVLLMSPSKSHDFEDVGRCQ